MRLCDSFLSFRPGDEASNRCPGGPLRSTIVVDQFRCLRCAGWTPHGGLTSVERVVIIARETASITARFAHDYAWAHSVAFSPSRRNGTGGSSAKGLPHGDPTGNSVADVQRAAVRDRAVLAARLLERALRDLRAADEAIGDALLAAEPPGPVDHTKAPFHDVIPDNRPDLEESYAARARRRARGEGVPT